VENGFGFDCTLCDLISQTSLAGISLIRHHVS